MDIVLRVIMLFCFYLLCCSVGELANHTEKGQFLNRPFLIYLLKYIDFSLYSFTK
jgi:hypothetical protein